jgi:hypothetical protein
MLKTSCVVYPDLDFLIPRCHYGSLYPVTRTYPHRHFPTNLGAHFSDDGSVFRVQTGPLKHFKGGRPCNSILLPRPTVSISVRPLINSVSVPLVFNVRTGVFFARPRGIRSPDIRADAFLSIVKELPCIAITRGGPCLNAAPLLASCDESSLIPRGPGSLALAFGYPILAPADIFHLELRIEHSASHGLLRKCRHRDKKHQRKKPSCLFHNLCEQADH